MKRSHSSLLLFLTVLWICGAGLCLGQVITTVAGGTFVFSGNGGPAVAAPLGYLSGVAVDASGNVYAADRDNNLVVKIAPSGTLTVVAGNGINGFSGDGGPAISASLSAPSGVAVDAAGNLYISANNRVRKVTQDGTITTVAGNGSFSFSGDGGPAVSAALWGPAGLAVDAAGNLYIADSVNNRVRKVSPAGTITTYAGNGNGGFSNDAGPAVNASLFTPSGLAVDLSGDLYIADRFNNRIRKVSPGGIISTVAGNGTAAYSGDGGSALGASLNGPLGVAVDASGNLHIADTSNNVYRRVGANGIISTVAGTAVAAFSGDGGPAAAATLNGPGAVAVNPSGTVYIADSNNLRVRQIAASGISTIAGNGQFKFAGDLGPAASASLNNPAGVAFSNTGQLYVADTNNQRIRLITPAGTIATAAGVGTAGFSGDGNSATSAALRYPNASAVDSVGNVYIADTSNHRIRRVTPGGIITTVAGAGTAGFSGDGGPPASASLNGPTGVAIDNNGNLYIADAGNDRIRRVTSGGTISTVAGNGAPGFSGDGGPAASASLNFPNGVALDLSGNLYIADTNNHRIRVVNSSGGISTVAGNGAAGSSGDGGPATAASLLTPVAVAVSASGNVFVADKFNQRIRQFVVGGNIATVAGNGASGFAGDGGPATAASLNNPSGVALDAPGNLYIADSANDRIREVLASLPSFSLSPASLSFSTTAGAAAVPAQQVAVTSIVTGLPWTAQVATESGGNWLTISAALGTAPGIVTVSVNLSGLNPGTYTGSLIVQSPQASPGTQTVAVALTIAQSLAPQLFVDASSMTFEIQSGAGNPPSQSLRIGNAGSGTLNWTAAVKTADGGSWLAVSAASGSAAGSSPSVVTVSVNAAGMPAGVYSGTLIVSSAATGETSTVSVILLLDQATQTILLSQSGLLFTGVEGGTLVPNQTFGVLNTGQGTMNWKVSATMLSGGNWLAATPASGASTAGSLSIPMVEVDLNASGLTKGQYSGQIRVDAPGANNSPQFVTVVLNILPKGSNPGVLVRPTGLIFARQEGTSSPSSQTVRLATAVPGNVTVVTNPSTFQGGDWLNAQPRNLVVSPTQPGNLTIQPTLGTLPAGQYFGGVTLLFSDLSSQVVNVLFLVVKSGAGASTEPPSADRESEPRAAATGFRPADQSCAPQQLLVTQRALGSNFVSPVGWPSTIEAQVIDDCGNSVPNAGVVASFSNGDPPLPLTSLGDGIYVGTWKPVNPTGQVTVTLRANLPPLAPAQTQAQGQVQANTTAPFVNSGGIVNAASFASGKPMAPGSIVSVFGLNLAASQSGASVVPLPTTLSGASLNVGGIDAPLFYGSNGQINAQLPFELTPNSRPQVVVRVQQNPSASQTATVPETVTIATAQPAIFTINQQGTGQGAILNAQGILVDSGAPATVGDTVQVFATGLGITQPAIASGSPAPSAEPLARVTVPVQAQIGGLPATVQFAGLAPGYVGLYQVNVQVPAGVTPGPAVPLVLLQNGVPSNTVTLAIQ